jgi:hypothetical protein
MVVKTFRGLLADGGQDRIRLSTIKGKVGYRIIKLQLMAENPGTTDYEHVVKIYKSEQSSITGDVNFTDSDVMAAGYLEGNNSSNYIGEPQTIIFDNEMFNQDIYVSHFDAKGALACNYYLELEVIPLDDAGAEYTTLKDMRTG